MPTQRLPLACILYGSLNQDNYAAFCQTVHDGLLASIADFPTPPILPAALQTLIDAYNTALANAVNLGKGNVQAKNAARFNLQNAMRANANYVNQIIQAMIQAGTSYADARTLILGTGYFESQNPSPAGELPAPIINHYRSTVKGQMNISVKKVKNAKSYQILYGLSGLEPTDLTVAVSPNTRIVISGLTSGLEYQFQVAAIGANPALNYSVNIFQVIV